MPVKSVQIFFLGLSALQTACVSSQIIRDKEYLPAVEAYQRGDVKDARSLFPEGEQNGFIPSVEKSWLNIWQEDWNPKDLQTQVNTFDQRKYTSLTREAGYFLFQESEEGYVPAEHEIVVLHLLSAIHFHQNGKTEEAHVELRRAGYVLDNYWDDAALRLWLGALWAGMGDWNEALVDFRRANALKPNPELAKLSTMRAPKNLTLHFHGNGPITEWPEGNYTPDFKEDRLRSDLPVAISTLPWFERHTKRNTELRDVLVKSNFMAQYLGNKTLTGAEYGLTKTTTWSLRALGVAVGAALLGGVLYLASQSQGTQSGEALGYMAVGSVGIGYQMWKSASDLDREWTKNIEADDRRKQESLRIYRMVRFMPTWIALEAKRSDPINYELKIPIKTISGPTQLDLINHF